MFQLSELEHTLQLKPHLLGLPINEAIKGELESLFLDKIIADLGLCISVYDIQSIDGGFILPNEGAPTYTVLRLCISPHSPIKKELDTKEQLKPQLISVVVNYHRYDNGYQMIDSAIEVKFRLIIFQPFVGEIISAKLKESNVDGLRLSLGFFEDIYIPEMQLPDPSYSEPDSENKNQVKWIWKYEHDSHDTKVVIDYLIDECDEIRFRVHNITFPEIPKEQKDLKPFAPMEITGSIVAEGLGPISWWV